ncbi:MAG: serine/threonine-protein phosphatase [Bacteroidia bacterium]|nr:serine/threonine-protein phosphatase [Bacteroidia bacterium]
MHSETIRSKTVKRTFNLFNSLIETIKRSNITHQRGKNIQLKTNKFGSRDELNDSIIYAKRIQEGMMLKEKHLHRLFPESFLLFKPKDIVSGDFYWFTRIENKTLIAVADCTGHGIPGAFMSVLGISLLNQIVIEERNTDVSFILQRLDHKLKKAFSYSMDLIDEERHPYDGMDIALCCIDQEKGMITFSGALRPIYHISDDLFNKYDGSRYPIGGLRIEEERKYECQEIEFKKGDRLFLTSDGYADQFGGDRNKKFMVKNLKENLVKTSRYSIQTQHLELERIHREWKNNNEQTDDILLIGIQL